MSLSSSMDIVRFKMNSKSSLDSYSPPQINEQQDEKYNAIKPIPLILKKMNPVQRYVHDFKVTEYLQKQQRPQKIRSFSPLYDPSLSTSEHLKKIISKSPTSQKISQQELKDLEQKCYIKYSSISSHDTGMKYEALENCQTQYVRLKHSLHHNTMTPTLTNHESSQKYDLNVSSSGRSLTVHLPNERPNQSISEYSSIITNLAQSPLNTTNNKSFVNPKSIYLLNKKKLREQKGQFENKIHSQDIEKQLKTSVIQQNGKKYFADLYLMKKQRDKMMKEIFGASEKNKVSHKDQPHSISTESNGLLNVQSNNISRNPSMRSQKASFSLQKDSKLIHSSNDLQKKFPKLKVNLKKEVIKRQEKTNQSQDENYIQQKILRQRSQKKQKMLKGRNMNWNVYYEMLALKKNEKDKLKGYCKFSQTYGQE